METTFIKRLTFPSFPLTYIYISHDYTSANTVEELIEVCYKWMETAETTLNSVAKEVYISASKALTAK